MTKHVNTTLSMVLMSSLVLLIGTSLSAMIPITQTALAADQPDASSIPLPKELTSEELESLIDSLLTNTEIQQRLEGKEYEIMSYDFIGNENDKPFVWYPEIHINVENTTQLTVLFGKGQPSMNSVSGFEELPMAAPIQAIGSDTNRGFATNYYTGSSSPKGIRLNTVAPSQSTGDVGMAFVVNGVTFGSQDGKLCNAAYYGNTYFGQAGFQWTTGGLIVWADTATNCVPQFPMGISYVGGHSYEFKLYSSGGTWYIYGKDITNNDVFSKPRSGIFYAVLKNNDRNTSVFLETQISSPNGSILSPYPSGTSKISTDSGATWFNWQSGARLDQSCTNVNHIYPYDSTKQVISGNLSGGGTATFNTVRMATNYPAC